MGSWVRVRVELSVEVVGLLHVTLHLTCISNRGLG